MRKPAIQNIDGTVTMSAHIWEWVLDLLNDNLVAWEGEEWSVRDEHADLIERLTDLDHYLTAHSRETTDA